MKNFIVCSLVFCLLNAGFAGFGLLACWFFDCLTFVPVTIICLAMVVLSLVQSYKYCEAIKAKDWQDD